MSYWFPYLIAVTCAELPKCHSDSTIHHLLQVTLYAPRTTTTDTHSTILYTSLSQMTTTMPYDNEGNHHNNDGDVILSALRKDMERWNVIEEEEDVSLTRHPPDLDDMTQQVESLLHFMDQYQTFSPLLKNRLNDDSNKGNGKSKFHQNDSNHEPKNQVDASFLHHSTVVSSSSSSSSSWHGLDVPIEPDDTHHSTTNNNNTVMNASSSSSPPPLLELMDDHDDPSVSPVATFGHAERDQLRRWVTQVRQAVHEWVQAHRHYVDTQAAAAASLPNEDHFQKFQIVQQQYEQTIVSLNDIIQEQRRRIHELERQQQLGPSHATHGIDKEAIRGSTVVWPQSTRPMESSTVVPPRIHDCRRVDHPPLLSPPPPPPHTRHPTATTTASTTAVVIKTKNCKRIAHSNGTVHEIYYDDNDDRTRPGSSRPRLYEIIRFYNGDVKMTTGDYHDNDDDDLEETYYYYATSGVIQIARRPRPDCPSSSPTTKSLPPTRSRIEYHYPNGQIEYHIGTERVIQFPNGRTTHVTTDPENVEPPRPLGTR